MIVEIKHFIKWKWRKKKWQKALEAGDPKIIERRAKAEKSRADYEAILNETKLEAEGLLETKDSFIESTFIALRRIEAGFYRKLAESFDRLDKQRSASFTTIYDSSHQPLRYSNNQVGNPFDTPAKGELHQPTTEAIIVEKRLPPQQLTSALGGQTNQSLWNQQSPQQYGQQSRTSEFESDVLNTLDIDLM